MPNVTGLPQRLTPPDSLGKDEARVFRELVAACDARHFDRSDLPLLCRYVEAAVLAERAAKEMRENGPVLKGGRASPWLTIQEKSVRALVALSLRLRIAPQSRLDPKTAGRRAGRPASPYEGGSA